MIFCSMTFHNFCLILWPFSKSHQNYHNYDHDSWSWCSFTSISSNSLWRSTSPLISFHFSFGDTFDFLKVRLKHVKFQCNRRDQRINQRVVDIKQENAMPSNLIAPSSSEENILTFLRIEVKPVLNFNFNCPANHEWNDRKYDWQQCW